MPRLNQIHGESLDAERRINREFGYLLKLVYDGNQTAAEYLHDILQGQLKTFTYLCNKSPELFKPIARQRTKWPGFVSDDVNVDMDNPAMIAKIKLGENAKKQPELESVK